MDRELEKSIEKNKLIKEIKKSGTKIQILETPGHGKILVKKLLKSKTGKEDGLKSSKINKKLKLVKNIRAPKILYYSENKIIMEYIDSISFEKFYINNLNDKDLIKKKLHLTAKMLSKIHSIKKEENNEKVYLHGDFHPENILIEKNNKNVVVIDSIGDLNENSFYEDLAMFIYHLNFKIPYKYKSLKAYFVSERYIKYFLDQYSFFSNIELDKNKLNKYRIKNLKLHKKRIKNINRNKYLKLLLLLHLNIKIYLLK